jgi:hypothetical protein
MVYSIFWPAMSLGNSSTVLRSGMPSEEAGPVVDSTTPTLIWACADRAAVALTSSARTGRESFQGLNAGIGLVSVRDGKKNHHPQ